LTGFEAPAHRALAEPTWLAGAPCGVAIRAEKPHLANHEQPNADQDAFALAIKTGPRLWQGGGGVANAANAASPCDRTGLRSSVAGR